MNLACRFLLLPLTLLVAACSNKELPTHQEQGYVFGTLVEVSVYGKDENQSKQAISAVMQEFQRLNDLLHAWKPSELSRLNEAIAVGKGEVVPVEVASLLQDAAQISAQSGGLFNPAIGGLIKLWGFQSDEFKAVLPDDGQVRALVAADPRMSDLSYVPAGPDKVLVRSSNKAVRIDLGGYAKGYALDRAAELLRKLGIHDALINIGGNVLAMGTHGDRAWLVGIQHPRKPGPIATLALHDGEAIGTSGDYQRYFLLGGKRYCHIIDPRNGYPVQGVEAVTILVHGAHAGTRSDAPSKPLFVSGLAGWRRSAQLMHIDQAMLIDAEGAVHLTMGMQKRLELTDKNTVLETE